MCQCETSILRLLCTILPSILSPRWRRLSSVTRYTYQVLYPVDVTIAPERHMIENGCLASLYVPSSCPLRCFISVSKRHGLNTSRILHGSGYGRILNSQVAQTRNLLIVGLGHSTSKEDGRYAVSQYSSEFLGICRTIRGLRKWSLRLSGRQRRTKG